MFFFQYLTSELGTPCTKIACQNSISKMAKLNQNKNSKESDQPDAVWKLDFTVEINE